MIQADAEPKLKQYFLSVLCSISGLNNTQLLTGSQTTREIISSATKQSVANIIGIVLDTHYSAFQPETTDLLHTIDLMTPLEIIIAIDKIIEKQK